MGVPFAARPPHLDIRRALIELRALMSDLGLFENAEDVFGLLVLSGPDGLDHSILQVGVHSAAC